MSERFDVGIVGDGQLGRMLTEAASSMDISVAVMGSTPNSPAAQVGAYQFEAKNLYDRIALGKLVSASKVTTIEIEHTDAAALAMFSEDFNIQPSPYSLAIIQDKYDQKTHLDSWGLPTAPFYKIDSKTDLDELEGLGKDLIVKSRFGAYDGRGNMVYRGQEWDEIIKGLSQDPSDPQLYAEEIVPFVKELSGLVARGSLGETAAYPIVETIHRHNICNMVISPATITDAVAEKARDIAIRTVDSFKGAGVFAVEMFLKTDGAVLVNEVAPRVHNSGHHTIEANQTSQFEQHLRAILGLPLGGTEMISPSVMINILGERNGPTNLIDRNIFSDMDNTHLHLYGKSPTKLERKMGHITVLASNTLEAFIIAEEARRRINI